MPRPAPRSATSGRRQPPLWVTVSPLNDERFWEVTHRGPPAVPANMLTRCSSSCSGDLGRGHHGFLALGFLGEKALRLSQILKTTALSG